MIVLRTLLAGVVRKFRRTAGQTSRVVVPALIATMLGGQLACVNAGATESCPAPTFFVSKSGDNTTGGDWQHAFSELEKINWKLIPSGSIIVLDGGGIGGAQYDTTLSVPGDKSVLITVSPESGRNGRLTIRGKSNGAGAGIKIAPGPDYRVVAIDGNRGDRINPKIQLTHFLRAGVIVDAGASRVELCGLSVRGNGEPAYHDFERPDGGSGVLVLSGHSVDLRKSILQDNPVDVQINSETAGARYTVAGCLLYKSLYQLGRRGRAVEVSHVGANTSTIVQHCIIGPCLNRGVVNESEKLSLLKVDDCLFINCARQSVSLEAVPKALDLRRITSIMNNVNTLNETTCAIFSEGKLSSTVHMVNNSIFYGGSIKVPVRDNQTALGVNNYQFRTSGNKLLLGTATEDPFFRDLSNLGYDGQELLSADYSLKPGSEARRNGAGSTITTVGRFLAGF